MRPIPLENTDFSVTDKELVDLFEFRHNPIARFYKYLGTKGAEWNYSVGVPLNYQTDFSTTIPAAAALGITLGWNYLDGIYSISLGIMQLLDEEDYRQTQNKIKGVLNIISGVELFLLSYNPALTGALGLSGGAALAAPAFALGMALDLVSASIDFYNAHKEVKFEGWLEERAQEISYNQKRIDALSNKLSTLDPDNEKELLEIKYLNAKIKTLETKINDIHDAIYARSRVYCHDNLNGTYQDRVEKVKSIIHTYLPENDNEQLTNELKNPITDFDREVDKSIQTELNKNHREHCIKLTIKTASFIGMTLLAVSAFVSCPPLLMTGLAVTSVVALYYGYKNSKYLAAKCGFFSGKVNDPLDKQQVSNLNLSPA